MASRVIHGNNSNKELIENVSLYMSQDKVQKEEIKYKLELSEEQIKLYVAGLDSAVKLIAQQLLQGNSALVLKQLLPKLIEINNELQNLDQIIDSTKDKQIANNSN
jgi:hypothetical protein